MGLDSVTGIGTGCWPGMRRLANYLFGKFGGGDLGCFNPASRAGGGPSLHAEGRAQDFAFNANNPDERVAGDALFRWAVEHADEIGLQEMLWRGAIWYFPRAGAEHGWGDFQIEGVYGPVQQSDHMSHVHLGVDKNAGMNWQPDWITEDDMPLTKEDRDSIVLPLIAFLQDNVSGFAVDGQTRITNRAVIDVLAAKVDELEQKIDTLTQTPSATVALLPSDVKAIAKAVVDLEAKRLEE